MKIWIIHGTTGEYSDRGEWVVEAHDSKDAAMARIVALDALLLAHGYKHGEPVRGDWKERDAAKKAFRELSGDSHFDADYTGTSYFLSECDLKQGQREGGD